VAESQVQDRTEQATPKRRREARRRGEVPRSRELTTLGIVGGVVLALGAFGDGLAQGCVRVMRAGLTIDPALLADPWQLPLQLGASMRATLDVAMPLLGATFVAALLAPLALGGWNFSPEAVLPKFSRINPLSGFGRIFAASSLVELAKALGKFALLGGIGAAFCAASLGKFLALGRNGAAVGVAEGFSLLVASLGWLTGGLALLAAIDAPYQAWSYAKRLRMTRQELREESKESEGRPEVKARIRRLQQEMSQRRMMEKVPKADVIVTNPTHYAVALQYASGAMRAPRVVAKGADLVADAIRDLGREHRVPILSAPPLARALYRACDLDQEIPGNLYAAVAQVLSYVYQLRSWRTGPPPQAPDIGAVVGGDPD
jgi:flagellar biosynthetic protein FlhB